MNDKLNEAIEAALARAETTQRTDGAKPTGKKVPKERIDGLINALMGLGTGHDRTSYDAWNVGGNSTRLDGSVLTDMFRHDDMARRICTFRPSEATRQGFTTGIDDLDAEVKRRGLLIELRNALTWENLFGGSAILMGIDDGKDPKEPVGERVRSVDWLQVYDRTWLQPTELKIKDRKDPDFDKPYGYTIRNTTDQSVYHRSRFVIFPGALTPIEIRNTVQQGWGDSVIEMALKVILSFARGFASVGVMLSEANQAVFSIEGLINSLAEGDTTTIVKRMQLMNITRGVARALVLDAKEEKFQNNELSFTGVSQVLDALMLRLSAALEIPVTILMGRSPAGLNATGESDFRAFYDSIRTYQQNVLSNKVDQLLRVLMSAREGATRGKIPEEYNLEFNSLWQETKKEKADTYKTVAEADALYLNWGVVTPEEVALSRFNADGFGIELEIDRAVREEVMAGKGETAQQPGPPLITPTDMAKVVTVNEARRSANPPLPPLPGPEGALTVGEFFALAAAKETEQQGEVKPEPPKPDNPPQQPPQLDNPNPPQFRNPQPDENAQ